MQIRSLQPSDATAWQSLYQAAWMESTAYRPDETAQNDAACFVLEKAGALIGFYFFCAPHAGQPAQIAALYISPAWRRRGYATFCMKDALRRVKSRDDMVILYGPQDSAAMHALGRKFGFLPENTAATGTRSKYVRPPSVPTVNALQIAHHFLGQFVRPGAFVLDATAGRGRDTAYLCRLAGPHGKVVALDIQQEAVDATNALLAKKGYAAFARAVCDTHTNLASYAAPESVDAIVFNLGYLPGGNHALFTMPETTVPAIQTALSLLRAGGVMTICLYAGGLQGTHEKDAVLHFVRNLNPTRYTVMAIDFSNRMGGPLPVCILKHSSFL